MSDKISTEALALALARDAVDAIRRSGSLGDPYNPVHRLVAAFDVLDNRGSFSPIDRQTDYMAAADVLAENAAERPAASPAGLAYSQIRHPSRVNQPVAVPEPGQGFTQDSARALFGDTEPEADGRF